VVFVVAGSLAQALLAQAAPVARLALNLLFGAQHAPSSLLETPDAWAWDDFEKVTVALAGFGFCAQVASTFDFAFTRMFEIWRLAVFVIVLGCCGLVTFETEQNVRET